MASEADPDDWSWADGTSDWVPPAIDTTRPSVARMYDYFIGGKDHFAVDREAAEGILRVIPDAANVARANREFLIRAAGAMAQSGIEQFLDVGAGIPSSPSVHETVRAVRPEAAVVYLDNDPVVLAHNRAMFADDDRIVTVAHDLREPSAVLGDPVVRGTLDLDRPVGVLFIAVMHFVDLANAPRIVARYVRDLAPGSHVAITAVCRDGMSPEALEAAEAIYARSSAPVVSRTVAQIEQLFDGLTLQAPGVHEVYRVADGGSIQGGIAVK